MSMRVLTYNEKELKELPLDEAVARAGCNKWVSLISPGPDELKAVAEKFGLHPLVVKDIQNERELPKVYEYSRYTFIILDVPEHGDDFTMRKLYIVIGKDFLISITGSPGIIHSVDAMLFRSEDPIQKLGVDYLGYFLIDRAVDRFYPILDDVEDMVSDVEERVVEKPGRDIIQTISEARRHLLKIRKSAWLNREVLSALERSQSPHFAPETVIYLRDVYDHIVQVMDLVETYRDILAAARDTYMSSVSNSLNEVMKQLTIIATVMLPLTFIASFYGMNFTYLPGLDWEYSLYFMLALMAGLTAVMLIYFRKKRWI